MQNCKRKRKNNYTRGNNQSTAGFFYSDRYQQFLCFLGIFFTYADNLPVIGKIIQS